MERSPLVFIASPVTHSDDNVVEMRMEMAARFAAWVMDTEKKNVFPAAVADMNVTPFRTTAKSAEWWDVNMETFMEPAESCYVLALDGWESSGGVALEVGCAKRLGKEIYYYKPSEDGGFVRQ